MKLRSIKSLLEPSVHHKEIINFAIVGISSSLVYMAIITILSINFYWKSTPAIIFAYAVGTLVSYIGSGILAFRKKMTGSNLAKFLVVVGLAFLVNIVISEILSPLGVHTVVIGGINVLFVGGFNFFCHKFWTFRDS